MIRMQSERRSQHHFLVPAQAGTQVWCATTTSKLDSRAVTKMRGNDAVVGI
jgi:hypothetical protein